MNHSPTNAAAVFGVNILAAFLVASVGCGPAGGATGMLSDGGAPVEAASRTSPTTGSKSDGSAKPSPISGGDTAGDDDATDGDGATDGAPRGDVATPADGSTGDAAIDGGSKGNGYYPSSRFDRPLPDNPTLDPNSSAIVASFVTQYKNNYGSVGVSCGTNGIPIYTVPANQATVTINSGMGTGDITGSVPIPPGAYTTGNGDSEIVIYQPSSQTEWEMWQATPSGSGNWTASWGGILTGLSTSTGIFPSPYGLSASGISYLATTITFSDIQAGAIHHAIPIDIVTCNNGYVAPADRTDGNQGCGFNSAIPAEGMWFFMPKSVTMPSGLAPFAQMVFTALQEYGAVAIDHAGAVMIGAENSEVWAWEGHSGTDPVIASFNGQQEYQVVANLPWASMQVLAPAAP